MNAIFSAQRSMVCVSFTHTAYILSIASNLSDDSYSCLVVSQFDTTSEAFSYCSMCLFKLHRVVLSFGKIATSHSLSLCTFLPQVPIDSCYVGAQNSAFLQQVLLVCP